MSKRAPGKTIHNATLLTSRVDHHYIDLINVVPLFWALAAETAASRIALLLSLMSNGFLRTLRQKFGSFCASCSLTGNSVGNPRLSRSSHKRQSLKYVFIIIFRIQFRFAFSESFQLLHLSVTVIRRPCHRIFRKTNSQIITAIAGGQRQRKLRIRIELYLYIFFRSYTILTTSQCMPILAGDISRLLVNRE